MEKLKIFITGSVASGKSAAADAIKRLFEQTGHQVVVVDDEPLHKRRLILPLLEPRQVEIYTIQTIKDKPNE